MSQDVNELSKQPAPGRAEDNAFFPSSYSLGQYTAPKMDFDGVEHKGAYKDGKWKILMVAVEERYILLENGKVFSMGNHPVETSLPLRHLMEVSFDVDVVTLSGYPVKLELWTMPAEDEAVINTHNKSREKLKQSGKLTGIIKNELGPGSDYLSIFIPDGYAAIVGISENEGVQQTLDWALDDNRFIVILCHESATLLSTRPSKERSPLGGYSVCAFPDSLGEDTNAEIGYSPGRLKWLVANLLAKQGLKIVSDGMTGGTLEDRKSLTGDSLLASSELGKLATDEMLNVIQNK